MRKIIILVLYYLIANSCFSQSVDKFIRAGGPILKESNYKFPQYKGDNHQLISQIESNLEYPIRALALGVQGVVTLNFVISKEGTISDIKLTRDIGAGCGNLVVDFMKNTNGKWIVGDKGQDPQSMTIWVAFNLVFNTRKLNSIIEKKSEALEYFKQEKYKRAKSLFDDFLQTYTYDIESIEKRARCYEALENRRLACKDWNLLVLMGELSAKEGITANCND